MQILRSNAKLTMCCKLLRIASPPVLLRGYPTTKDATDQAGCMSSKSTSSVRPELIARVTLHTTSQC